MNDEEYQSPFGKCVEGTCIDAGCIGESDWEELTRSYLTSTLLLAQNAPQSSECHPLAFLLRHSIELLLKYELIENCDFPHAQAIQPGHKLVDLADNITCKTEIFSYIDRGLIAELDQIDQGSFEFRYPTNQTGDRTNCENLCCVDKSDIIGICNNMLGYLDT